MPHSAGSNTLVSRGSTVKFTCNYGHYFSDDSVEKEFDCDNDGNWESGGTTNWTCDGLLKLIYIIQMYFLLCICVQTIICSLRCMKEKKCSQLFINKF